MNDSDNRQIKQWNEMTYDEQVDFIRCMKFRELTSALQMIAETLVYKEYHNEIIEF